MSVMRLRVGLLGGVTNHMAGLIAVGGAYMLWAWLKRCRGGFQVGGVA